MDDKKLIEDIIGKKSIMIEYGKEKLKTPFLKYNEEFNRRIELYVDLTQMKKILKQKKFNIKNDSNLIMEKHNFFALIEKFPELELDKNILIKIDKIHKEFRSELEKFFENNYKDMKELGLEADESNYRKILVSLIDEYQQKILMTFALKTMKEFAEKYNNLAAQVQILFNKLNEIMKNVIIKMKNNRNMDCEIIEEFIELTDGELWLDKLPSPLNNPFYELHLSLEKFIKTSIRKICEYKVDINAPENLEEIFVCSDEANKALKLVDKLPNIAELKNSDIEHIFSVFFEEIDQLIQKTDFSKEKINLFNFEQYLNFLDDLIMKGGEKTKKGATLRMKKLKKYIQDYGKSLKQDILNIFASIKDGNVQEMFELHKYFAILRKIRDETKRFYEVFKEIEGKENLLDTMLSEFAKILKDNQNYFADFVNKGSFIKKVKDFDDFSPEKH